MDSTRMYFFIIFFLCLSPHNSSAYGPILMIFFYSKEGNAPVVPFYSASIFV